MQTSLGGTSRPALGPPGGPREIYEITYGNFINFPLWHNLHILRFARAVKPDNGYKGPYNGSTYVKKGGVGS
jgi:hypothetical protein